MKASDAQRMSIGELADLVGLPTHVLRYWEEEGLLSPERDSSGYRRFTRRDLTRVILIRRNQSAGMTLEQIRALVDSGMEGRRQILREHLQSLARREADLARSRAMTEHALECRAHDVTTCPSFVRLVGDLAEGRAVGDLAGGRAPAGRVDGVPRSAPDRAAQA